jgi:hypothetical protein
VRGTTAARTLLRTTRVDLVVVSTPPNTHADWVLRALQAGKHVVVEKPFCLTVEEATGRSRPRDAGLTLPSTRTALGRRLPRGQAARAQRAPR